MVGRESGEIRLEVADDASGGSVVGHVAGSCLIDAVVATDDWRGYDPLAATGRVHERVSHQGPKSTWARDDDGDGVREVHCNSMEGVWTGLRNFLRPFRGVSKWRLDQYVAVFQWAHNAKRATDEFLRILLGRPPSTGLAS